MSNCPGEKGSSRRTVDEPPWRHQNPTTCHLQAIFIAYYHVLRLFGLISTWSWCSVLRLWRRWRTLQTKVSSTLQTYSSVNEALFSLANGSWIFATTIFKKSSRQARGLLLGVRDIWQEIFEEMSASSVFFHEWESFSSLARFSEVTRISGLRDLVSWNNPIRFSSACAGISLYLKSQFNKIEN